MQLFRTKSVEQTIAETGEEGRKLKRNLTLSLIHISEPTRH